MHQFSQSSSEKSIKKNDESKIRLDELQDLAKRIIQTDILFQKYTSKEQECEKIKAELSSSKADQIKLQEKCKYLIKENELINKKYKSLIDEIEQVNKQLDQANTKAKETLNSEKKASEHKLRVADEKNENLLKQLRNQESTIEKLHSELATEKEQQERLKAEIKNISFTNENLQALLATKSTPAKTEAKINVMQQSLSPCKPKVIFSISSSSSSSESDMEQQKKQKTPVPQSQITQLKDSDAFCLSDEDEDTVEPTNKDVESEEKNKQVTSSSSSDSESSSSDSDSEDSLSSTDEKEKNISVSKFSTDLKTSISNAFNFEVSDDDFLSKSESMVEAEETVDNSDVLKINDVLNGVIKRQVEDLFDESVYKTSIEFNHCEFYLEKLLMEIVKTEVRVLACEIYGAELKEKKIREQQAEAERKSRERQEIDEIRKNICDELVENMIQSKVDAMLQECSERVVTECRKERLESIYEKVLEEVIPKMIEKELFEVIFNEMNPKKALIKSIQMPCEELGRGLNLTVSKLDSLVQQSNSPVCLKKPLIVNEVAKKRIKPEIDEVTRSDLIESPMKRPKKSNEEVGPMALVDKKKLHPSKIVKYVKDRLADYMRSYNIKIENFSFENLDLIITDIANSEISLKAFTNLIVGHYINNAYIPVEEARTIQQDNYELNLFKDLNTLFMLKEKGGHTSHMHMSYKQNKVDKCLNVTPSMEEEKYVYLIKKLMEISQSDSQLKQTMFEFVSHLKVMMFSGDFIDHYNYRIARMICFMCKSTENFEYLRCLVWDLIAAKNEFMPLNFHKIIILFARIWPDLLQWPFSSSLNITESKHFELSLSLDLASSANPILCSIIFIVQNHMNNFNKLSANYSNETMHSKYYSYILETLCNWSLPFTQAQQIFDEFNRDLEKLSNTDPIFILDDSNFKLTPIMFDYSQGLKLLCFNEGFDWCVENFTADNFQIHYTKKKLLAFYLMIQGFVTAHMCPKSSSNTALNTITKFEQILLKNQDTIIRCVCVESLLMLAPFDRDRCFDIIRNSNFKPPLSIEIKTNKAREFYMK